MRNSPGLGFIGLVGLLLLLVLSACQQQGGQTGGQPSFNIALNPTSLPIPQGQSGQTTLTLTPQNGFSGTVNLTLASVVDSNNNPVTSGFNVTFNPNSLTLPSQTQSTVTIGVAASVSPGTYTLTLQAQGGGVTQTASLTVTVQSGGGGSVGTSWTWQMNVFRSIIRSPFDQNTFVGVDYYHNLLVTRDLGYVGARPTWRFPEGQRTTAPAFRAWTYGRAPDSDRVLFVAVGSGGNIYTSPDLRTWTRQESGVGVDLFDVVYGLGRFVALGTGGTILLSYDGVNWTHQELGIDLEAIAYGGGRFVAVGDGGTVVSEDGQHWRSVLRQGAGADGLVYGNGIFVGFDSYSRTFFVSRDGGDTWSPPIAVRVNGNWVTPTGIAYGNGVFVAVGRTSDIYILTSGDGENWQPRRMETTPAGSQITFDGYGQFLLTIGSTILVSPNGANWEQQSGVESGPPCDGGLRGIAFGNGRFIAVGNFGTVLSSSDGRRWNRETSGIEEWMDFSDVAYVEGTGFIAVGETIHTSREGTFWGQSWRSPGGFGSPGTVLEGVAYGQGQSVAVGWEPTFTGRRAVILTSFDLAGWTELRPEVPYGLNDIVFGNGRFVAVGDGGTILTSTDGANWTQQRSPTRGQLFSVIYQNGLFVVAAGGNSLLTSQDGTNWRFIYAGVDNVSEGDFRGVAYGDGTFVALGPGGIVATSADGLSWRGQRAVGGFLNDLAYGNNTFVAVGGGCAILTSP